MTTYIRISEAAQTAGMQIAELEAKHKPDAISECGQRLYDREKMLKLASENSKRRFRHSSRRLKTATLVKTFRAVAESANAGSAAYQLSIDRRTVCFRVRKLEGVLGFPLFYRPGYTRLTPAGRALLEGGMR